MEVTIKIPDELAAEARARGMSLELYLQEILARKTQNSSAPHRESISAAIDRIIELRKGNKLGGLSMKGLIRESYQPWKDWQGL